jgi:prefoldin subunit 4
MANASMDEDVHISYEDQSKINKFAIHNSKLHDIREEIDSKKKDLQNLSDALDELILLEEGTQVPFLYGEVFSYLDTDNANEELEKAKTNVEKDIKKLEEKYLSIKAILDELKVHLYGKFGKKINLEETEDD